MPSLKALRSNREKLPIPYGEHTVTIEWVPALLTGKFWQRMMVNADVSNTASGQDASDAVDRLREQLVPLIVGWDLTEDDELTPLAIDADTLGELPDDLIRRFVDEIISFGKQGKASTPGASGAGVGELPAPSPDGRHSFE